MTVLFFETTGCSESAKHHLEEILGKFQDGLTSQSPTRVLLFAEQSSDKRTFTVSGAAKAISMQYSSLGVSSVEYCAYTHCFGQEDLVVGKLEVGARNGEIEVGYCDVNDSDRNIRFKITLLGAQL